ncbi:glycoside hydrolase family 16 protein [Aplosporella prunicola CBS 121167]|uniref:Glycoside hydrolase family 16 protein n=1 Tax=Aplosporella prunicola CBS 121167 TaxID=1176127 RepID=A0A6A6BT53_9PEZI|nr:glycoside hydrolase family 16 protein [Aplosporella prunicola CBS 121167]KAF2146424.1 glycoside hydrolase family 16 protein [Aplosporella prunicola CBS 121167]
MLANRILGFLLPVAHAQYRLVDSYTPANFFSKFKFWTSVDPTNGYVQYVNQSVAEENKLIAAIDTIYMGVDMTNVYDVGGPGRPSVRIQSIDTYNRGLFILDLNHMPWGCGTWPAWWTAGNLTNWPADGEIDIIEGVHTNTLNTNQAYTSDGCSVAGTGQTGVADDLNCSDGCGSTAGSYGSYGGDFNTDGGVYAMEWTSSFIRVWFFPRGRIPPTITTAAPDPAEFGTPMANFQGNCDIDAHFINHQIIFDITFCGDWAGPAYQDAGCPMYQGMDSWDSCKHFVAGNPDKFSDAFWDINSLNVYQQDDPFPHAVPSSSVPAPTLSDSVALGKNAGVTSLIPSISPVIPTTASTSKSAIRLALFFCSY